MIFEISHQFDLSLCLSSPMAKRLAGQALGFRHDGHMSCRVRPRQCCLALLPWIAFAATPCCEKQPLHARNETLFLQTLSENRNASLEKRITEIVIEGKSSSRLTISDKAEISVFIHDVHHESSRKPGNPDHGGFWWIIFKNGTTDEFAFKVTPVDAKSGLTIYGGSPTGWDVPITPTLRRIFSLECIPDGHL